MFKITIDKYPDRDYKIKNITLSIVEGEIVGIGGKSGSGKSLLLKAIYESITRPENIISYIIHRIKYTFENPRVSILPVTNPYNLNENLEQYLLSSLQYKKKLFSPHANDSKAKVHYYSDKFGLTPLLSSRLSKLTDCQLKLAKIAYAFIKESPLLLLDNAFAFLDLEGVEKLQREIKRYTLTQNRSVVLTDQDLTYLFHTADSVYFMKDGNLHDKIDPLNLNTDIIKLFYGVNVLLSKNIYSGKPQVHLFPKN